MDHPWEIQLAQAVTVLSAISSLLFPDFVPCRFPSTSFSRLLSHAGAGVVTCTGVCADGMKAPIRKTLVRRPTSARETDQIGKWTSLGTAGSTVNDMIYALPSIYFPRRCRCCHLRLYMRQGETPVHFNETCSPYNQRQL